MCQDFGDSTSTRGAVRAAGVTDVEQYAGEVGPGCEPRPTGLAAGGLPEDLRIVGVDKAQIRFTQSPEFAQPLVIGLHPLPVEGNGAFHQAQRARRSAAAVELAVVIKAVTGMQNPAAAGIDRDGGVPTGVAGQLSLIHI